MNLFGNRKSKWTTVAIVSLIVLWYALGPTIWCPGRHYLPFTHDCRTVDLKHGTFLVQHLVLDYPAASYLSLQPKWGFGHTIRLRLPYEVSPQKHSLNLRFNGRYQLLVDGHLQDIEEISAEP